MTNDLEIRREPPPIIERFRAFHERHPHVYEAFERYALEALAHRAKIGAKAVWERLRWDALISTGESPQLNNDFTAYYARLFMARHPEFGRCFELRESAAERAQ